MYYTVRHITRFVYESTISESVMEARMQPRSDGTQRCIQFGLTTNPTARVMVYQDHDGNIVHHFNIPGRHSRLTLSAEALVECGPAPLTPYALEQDAWDELDAIAASGEFWEFLEPSPFVQPTPLLDALAKELSLSRTATDPLALLRRLTTEIYDRFEYSPMSTRVDSPIDEALLPDLGWVGFDPTNNRLAEDRHIRVAIGRDYMDVPPTRGVFKGVSAVRSELAVAVSVGPAQPTAGEPLPFVPWMSRDAASSFVDLPPAQHQQQQQQQQ